MIDLVDGRLSPKALVEDANHESGHAIAAVRLGIGPLTRGIELYPCGELFPSSSHVIYGSAFTCQKAQGSPGPRVESENSIQVLLAGPLAQFRLHTAFRRLGWELNSDIPTRSFEIRLDGWAQDLSAVNKYLEEIPERERAETHRRLLEATKNMVEHQLSAINNVAQELLCQYSPQVNIVRLNGERIVEVFNQINNTQARVISDCSSL